MIWVHQPSLYYTIREHATRTLHNGCSGADWQVDQQTELSDLNQAASIIIVFKYWYQQIELTAARTACNGRTHPMKLLDNVAQTDTQ
jgi:hypothetical protein